MVKQEIVDYINKLSDHTNSVNGVFDRTIANYRLYNQTPPDIYHVRSQVSTVGGLAYHVFTSIEIDALPDISVETFMFALMNTVVAELNNLGVEVVPESKAYECNDTHYFIISIHLP